MLVKNWKKIALKSYSMWAVYLGILTLVLPEVWYGVMGYDVVSPYLSGYLGVALLIYGGLGRLWDQGLNTFLAAFLALGVMSHDAKAMTQWSIAEPAQAEPHISIRKSFEKYALDLIGKWEGLRLNAYQDIVGVWTICYGHTKTARPGMTKTRYECQKMLLEEVHEYRDGLHQYFTTETKQKRLPPARDAAYVSLAYNVGIRGAGRSTATRRLNAGNVYGGCEALTWWNKAGGRVVRGLVRRRSEERQLCLRGL